MDVQHVIIFSLLPACLLLGVGVLSFAYGFFSAPALFLLCVALISAVPAATLVWGNRKATRKMSDGTK